MEDFPSDFVVDLSPTVHGYANHKALVVFLSLRTEIANKNLSVFPCSSFLFPVKSLYNLDEDQSQEAIAINLLPLMSQSELGRVTAGASNQSKRYLTFICGMAAKGKVICLGDLG